MVKYVDSNQNQQSKKKKVKPYGLAGWKHTKVSQFQQIRVFF
jgi:hypothetical protein